MIVDIETALQDYIRGKVLIVTDDENRENEGDFVVAAEHATPEVINFMATFGRGLICTPISCELADKLQLPPMVNTNTSHHHTAFTISIDLIPGNTTGISSFDRSRTIQAMIDPSSRPEDFMRPGHIFPLIGKTGGVLERDGHTEASLELSRLCDLAPASVICEILNPDGSMARMPDLLELAAELKLNIVTIDSLKKYLLTSQEISL